MIKPAKRKAFVAFLTEELSKIVRKMLYAKQ